ncbi:MFS transporter [Streptomyces celluloflavus]|uniref:MFS transporter n=1 Tax=Streptomyces celluloflavus TaxID=58344 RepID=A0ABW7RH38_9ACTN
MSALGNAFARVALSFAVLGAAGASPGRLSLVPACQALPRLVFILVGGLIADRMSRSRLMIATDLVGAAAYTGLAAMVLTGHTPLSAMCAPAVPAGVATALFVPATDGVVPLIVPAERLQHANGMLRVGTNSSAPAGRRRAAPRWSFWRRPRRCSPRRYAGCGRRLRGRGPQEGRQGGMDAREPCGQGHRDAGE